MTNKRVSHFKSNERNFFNFNHKTQLFFSESFDWINIWFANVLAKRKTITIKTISETIKHLLTYSRYYLLWKVNDIIDVRQINSQLFVAFNTAFNTASKTLIIPKSVQSSLFDTILSLPPSLSIPFPLSSHSPSFSLSISLFPPLPLFSRFFPNTFFEDI